MKKTKIDKLGRIVIPIQYRKQLGLIENTEINIEYCNRQIVITAADSLCRICSAIVDTNSPFPLCRECISRVRKAK